MKKKIYIFITFMIVIIVGLMFVNIKGYRLALGYDTGNSLYLCLPIIVKGQPIEVGHLAGRQSNEYHYLPVHPAYADAVCHLIGIE